MKKTALCLLVCTLLMSGCASEKKMNPQGIIVENIRVENYFNQGKNRQYFMEVPHRVLVIGAAQTETLLDLEVGDSIMAAVKYEDNAKFPIKENNRQKFDALHFISRQEINIERMLELGPDLIVSEESWYSKNKLGSTDYWNDRGVHTMVTLSSTAPAKSNEPETIEKEMKFVSDLGRVFHQKNQANHIVYDTMKRFQEIRAKTKGEKHPKVMILDLLSAGIVSYGRNKIAGDIASHLGAFVPETTAVVSNEKLMEENPDVVFVVTYGDEESVLHRLRDKPAFQHLSFIRNNRLYSIPLKYAYGPMTRIIDAAGYMGHCMYPDLINYEKEYDFHT